VELTGNQVPLSPVSAADTAELVRIRRTPEVTAAWDDGDGEPDFPFEEPDCQRWCIVLGRQVIGIIQACQELSPKYPHASIDVTCSRPT